MVGVSLENIDHLFSDGRGRGNVTLRRDTIENPMDFRRHLSTPRRVARTNEDRHPMEVVPYGRFGAGRPLWTGPHPYNWIVHCPRRGYGGNCGVIGLVRGIPAWRRDSYSGKPKQHSHSRQHSS